MRLEDINVCLEASLTCNTSLCHITEYSPSASSLLSNPPVYRSVSFKRFRAPSRSRNWKKKVPHVVSSFDRKTNPCLRTLIYRGDPYVLESTCSSVDCEAPTYNTPILNVIVHGVLSRMLIALSVPSPPSSVRRERSTRHQHHWLFGGEGEEGSIITFRRIIYERDVTQLREREAWMCCHLLHRSSEQAG